MESPPLPALPADPAPPPSTGQRAASEDRGFADAVRLAHAEESGEDRPAKPGRHAADTADKPRHGNRTGRRHKAHKTHHRDGSAQDATSPPALAAAIPAVVETKPTGGATPKPGPSPATANADSTDPAGIAAGKAAASSPATAGTDAGLPAAATGDFAAALGGADGIGKAATAGKGAVLEPGDGKATADKAAADKAATDKPSKDKPVADAAAVPAAPVLAGQAATAPSSAAADDDGVAATTANDSPGQPAARKPTIVTPAAVAAPAPKSDGAGTAGTATSGGDGKAASSAQDADPGQAADDKRKTAADDTRKSDAAKDKKAESAALDGQRTDGAARPDSTATDKPPASQPAAASAAAVVAAHQPSDRNAAPDAGQNSAQNAAITPASGFLHDLRAQSQLSTQQAQQPPADAAARLPTPPADQVAVQIGRAMQQGQDHLSVELHPAELGRISVDLQLGSDQRVVAVIHADHHDTLQLLQRDSHTLHRALQDAGLRTDSGSLSFNLRGDGGGSQQSFAQFSGSARPIALRMPAAATEAAARLVRPLRYGDSGIDIRV